MMTNDELAYKIGELSGKMDTNTALTISESSAVKVVIQDLAQRVTYLEREVLPALGRRSAGYGAVGGAASAATLIGGVYYFGKIARLWP